MVHSRLFHCVTYHAYYRRKERGREEEKEKGEIKTFIHNANVIYALSAIQSLLITNPQEFILK